MSKALTLTTPKAGKYLVQYKEMCRTIAACHGFDECKDIIDKSVAMAAYYAQIKDTETEVMFYRIRLRAWRRIAEMLRVVDVSKCETNAAKMRKVRSAFSGDPTVKALSDSRLTELVKLSQMSDSEFEYAVQQHINGSLIDLFRRTPTAEAEYNEAVRRRDTHNKEYAKREREEQEKSKAKIAAALEANAIEHKHLNELDQAAAAAMREVGITLERKDRANMKQVVFLIKEEVHSIMRQAAFDRHVTMQEVLRRGLKLWLEANGYEFPEDGESPARSRSKELTKEQAYG